MAVRTVVERDGQYWLDVPQDPEYFGDRAGPESLLLYFTGHGNEVDDPSDPVKMLGCLYDWHQVHKGLSDGDTIETPHGKFAVVSFHVVPA